MSARWEYIARQSINSTGFDNTYQALGVPLSSPIITVKLVNNSDQLVDVSTDGEVDHDILPANSFTLYDIRTNRQRENQNLSLPEGTQIFIKGAAAGTGLVYLVAIRERP